MSNVEAERWAAYSRKRGTFNLGVRIELGFAMLAALICHATGMKMTFSDFILSGRENDADDDEGEATLQDVMGILAGARR